MPGPIPRCANCFRDVAGEPCPHCGWTQGQPTKPPYLPVGTVLNGCYQIGRVLGHGGFGITYLSWDSHLDLPIAIKEYFPRTLASRSNDALTLSIHSGQKHKRFDDGLQRFQDEARTLAKFQQHPGIVSVYSFFPAHGTCYMVMEYVAGMTLKAYLKRKGPLSYKTVIKIMLPIMDALQAVHGEGLLHRDVSPHNIYITQRKQVKLLDFGAARFITGEYDHNLSVILKPGYAPEEQYRIQGKQGPWTDVYGLAATFYHCLMGVAPPEVLDRLERDVLQPLSAHKIEIPITAERALLRGLALKATDRFQDMESFRQALLKPEQEETQFSSQIHYPIRPSLPRPPPSLPLILGGGAVAGMLTLLWIFSNSVRHQPSPAQVISEPPPFATPTSRSGQAGKGGKGSTKTVPIAPTGLFSEQQEVAAGHAFLTGHQAEKNTAVSTAATPHDQFFLGMKYFLGSGVVQSDTQAAYWFRQAAQQGLDQAQLSLGALYAEGRGVPPSDTEAVKWYRLAAEQGLAQAQVALGVMYGEGRGVPKNEQEALRWYRQAATQGHEGALSVLQGREQDVLSNALPQ